MYNDDEITSHPDWNAQAYRVYLTSEGLKNNWRSRKSFFECYRGEWDSEEEFAQDWYDTLGEGPEWLREHVDWKSLADWLFSTQFCMDDNGIFVFKSSY